MSEIKFSSWHSSLLICLFILVGCGNENDYSGGSQPITLPQPAEGSTDLPKGLSPRGYIEEDSTRFRQRGPDEPVDILFTIDNSGSMDPFIAKVQAEIDAFVRRMTERNLRFRIGVLKATNLESSYEDFDPSLWGPFPFVNHDEPDVAEKVSTNMAAVRASHSGGSEVSLSILRMFYGHQDANSFFRRNSLHVYFPITDAEDIYNEFYDASSYRDLFNQRAGAGNWLVTAIGSPSYNPCRGTENEAQPVIEELTRISRGTVGRLCAPDYYSIMEAAVDQILSAQTEFSVLAAIHNAEAIIDESIFVTVDGSPVPRDSMTGFTWDPEQFVIAFDGQFKPTAGQIIFVRVEKYVE